MRIIRTIIAIALLSSLLFSGFMPVMSGELQTRNVNPDGLHSLHAKPWAFGQSEDRNSALWRKGVNGDVISRKQKANKAQENSGIGQEEDDGAKASLGLSFKDEAGTWKVAPEQKSMRPDEDRIRDRRHVVRAFADVEANDDLSFSIGPELILKDERFGDSAAKSDQPDSELGMGMNFKFDF